ncbi:transmembrane cytochrome oxidase [Rhodoferax lacus]|uniref:SURF1-like protein n=1 Tax=Rhodoferax lacus TaxID=2184758 RepID=A0A3E1RG16_9BURK|nr:transmembrane cytochrome oxidase [Rhodoferax lacus]
MLGIATTASLGQWQLNRAAQKESLQASMDAQSSKHRVDAALLLATADPTTLVHQHALLRGQWLADQTVYLDNRQMHAKVGFFAVTPLALEGSGHVILVQRGWVQRNFEERDKVPAIETPSGNVTVEGRIAPPPGKLFELGTPSQGAIRQNLDLSQMQAQLQAHMLPVLLVQTGAPSEGLLRDWPAVNLGVEKHYGYALQWFGMATLMALLYLWYQFLRPYFHRTKDSKPHA